MLNVTTLEQFKALSLNNTLELCYAIDNWVATMHHKVTLPVQFCDQAKQALIKTLITVRNDIRRRRMPDLSAVDNQSYYISIDHDMIVLGKQIFIDPYRPDEIDKIPEPFQIIGRYMFPILSVKDWAEMNGVEPNTVRQWINRERINIVKRNDNSIGISMMQYRPDAVHENVLRTAMYKEVHVVDESIANQFPFMRDKDILVLNIFPNRNATYRIIMIVAHTEDEEQPTQAQDLVLTKEETDKLCKAMDNAGFIDKREHNYIPPFPEAVWHKPYRLPTICDIEGAKASLKTFPSIGYIGKLEESDYNPIWETGAKVRNETILSVKGKLIRAATPADNLLTELFSAMNDTPLEAIKAVKNDSGWQIDNGWADDTLYVNEMTFKGANHMDDMILFLRTLPYRMYNICRHQFCRVIFKLPTNGTVAEAMLQSAGYRRVPDTDVYYAYVLW